MSPDPSPTNSPPAPQRLKVDGGHVAFDVGGSGPPIVFVHSVIADRRMWDREFAAQAAHHRVLRFDLRGFGGSSPATAPFSYAEDLRALLAHTHISRPIVVGSSMGGAIAMDFALAHPNEVAGLLLAAPGIMGGIPPPYAPEETAALEIDETQSRAIAQAWSEGDRATAFERLRSLWCAELRGPALDRFRTMVEQNAGEVFGGKSEQQAKPLVPAPFDRLGSLAIPTSVLAGDRDNPSMEFFCRRIARAIPDARLVRVSGADHLINLSRPDAFDAALDAVVRSAGGSK